MSEPRIVDRDDPEHVFSLLSDDIRVEILQALWAYRDPVPFSELYDAVDIDDSGRFNYHLDKLVDRFVRKTPEGYELTQAGRNINGAIEAGAYTLEASIDPIELANDCPSCGGVRTLSYDDEVVDIECETCELTYHFVVPPGVFDGYDTEAIPRVASQYLRATYRKIRSGFCWFCEGPMQPILQTTDAPAGPEESTTDEPQRSDNAAGADPDADGADERDLAEVPIANYRCQRCGHTATIGLWLLTLDHPAVQGFYYDQGIDIRDRRVWAFPLLDPEHLEIRSRDPLRGSVTHSVGGESLTLVIDEEAEVVEVSE